MHVHLLGACGTFMGGVARLARAAGHTVTGMDAGVYPPMSTQLADAGVALIEGFDPAQLDQGQDLTVVGNVMRRGMPVIERLLDAGMPYTSGPQWLGERVLAGQWVLAVAGTHGKTTTASMLAWILEYAGMQPGFLIGGVPGNFGVSARAGGGAFFVVEADEYDTAFFDKRSKFLHYRPRTLVMNNLEFDHADIFDDLAAIRRQFHHLVRTVPGQGQLVVNAGDPELERVLSMGCWTPVERFGPGADWRVDGDAEDGHRLRQGDLDHGRLELDLPGEHNRRNALAAILAARHAGVPVAVGLAALAGFRGVRRRLEARAEVNGVTIIDDFAHHPTAIAATLQALREQAPAGRLVVFLDPRSNSMRAGVHRARLPVALAGADAVVVHAPEGLGWDAGALAAELTVPTRVYTGVAAMAAGEAPRLRAGDRAVLMSNGGFGNLAGHLEAALREGKA